MGHNTVILIHNDQLHQIKEDKDYGAKLYYACCSFDRSRRYHTDRAVGTDVLWESHADCTALILAGGNQGKVVGSTYNRGRFWAPEDTERTVKDILKQEGYRVSRSAKDRVKFAKKDEPPAETTVIDDVAELARPKQAEVVQAVMDKLVDENRKLLFEVEILKARLAALGEQV